MSDLPSFRIQYLEQGTRLFRIHKAKNNPTSFFRGKGRFDDPDPTNNPYYTNYFSDSPLGCYAEVFGRLKQVTQHRVAQYQISTVILRRDVRLAIIDDPFNLGIHGFDASYYSCPNYDDSQRVANSVFSTGSYDGLAHPLRYTMGDQTRGQAFLSDKKDGTELLHLEKSDEIQELLIQEAFSRFRLRVM